MINMKELEKKAGRMALILKVNSTMGKKMEQEYIIFRMALFIKESF